MELVDATQTSRVYLRELNVWQIHSVEDLMDVQIGVYAPTITIASATEMLNVHLIFFSVLLDVDVR
jgi:hypothetical protein